MHCFYKISIRFLSKYFTFSFKNLLARYRKLAKLAHIRGGAAKSNRFLQDFLKKSVRNLCSISCRRRHRPKQKILLNPDNFGMRMDENPWPIFSIFLQENLSKILKKIQFFGQSVYFAGGSGGPGPITISSEGYNPSTSIAISYNPYPSAYPPTPEAFLYFPSPPSLFSHSLLHI